MSLIGFNAFYYYHQLTKSGVQEALEERKNWDGKVRLQKGNKLQREKTCGVCLQSLTIVDLNLKTSSL